VNGSEPALLPRPRRLRLDSGARVSPTGEVGYTVDQSLPAQGYRLRIDPGGAVHVTAADEAGRFYADATLNQLRAGTGDGTGDGTLAVGEVEDWPDLAVRGVMLDVSRTKVPTLETLFELVDRLASWKLNQLQLYIEHTFAYPGHEVVWEGSDPFSASDMAELRAYCAERHMELVANQNCLGHMERWLLHDRYAPLGIARGVVRGPMGIPMAASTLDPANPGSLALVGELLGTLSDAVGGTRLHVGLDEPWDLPGRRAGEWGSWLRRLRDLPDTDGRELLVWGDMPAAHPELLARVPEGVTVCEWGYEADHPFSARTGALAGASLPHWVCPGTSSWLSILGRASNALAGIAGAAEAAASSGATGMLVTDWGDFGHLQYPPVSDPGFAAAACMSWCLETNRDLDTDRLARLLDRHCYDDGAGRLGAAVLQLGDVHRLLPRQLPNISALVLHLYFPQLPAGEAVHGPLSAAHLDAIEHAIVDALSAVERARPSSVHGRRSVEELTVSGRLVLLCGADLRARLQGDGTVSSVDPARRQEMSDRLDDLVAAHREQWLVRNRPGGLDESCAWLEHWRACYRDGAADEDWAGPLVARVREHEKTAGR
jgi:hexosaminidase